MAETTGITWADATFNPWIGCTKVGPGCDHCYAEAQDSRKRWGGETHWGPGVPRRLTSQSNWVQPLRWDRARKSGDDSAPLWVFCASLADVFDNEVDPEWRQHLWDVMYRTTSLRWIVVTKRIGNAAKMLPSDWGDGYPNVGLVATVVDQAEADRDVPKLLATPARWRGLSVEPMLGPLKLSDLYSPVVVDDGAGRPMLCPLAAGLPILSRGFHIRRDEAERLRRQAPPMLDWVICGGESGPEARPMSRLWVRELRDECAAAGVPFHFKQWGEWRPGAVHPSETPGRFAFGDYEHDRAVSARADRYPRQFTLFGARCVLERVGVKAAGRDLDGVIHDARPRVYDSAA